MHQTRIRKTLGSLCNIPLLDPFSKDSARGMMCSIKNCSDDPTIFFFKIGISQIFEQEKSFVLREIGIRESNISGPMATTAEPMQSSSCTNEENMKSLTETTKLDYERMKST